MKWLERMKALELELPLDKEQLRNFESLVRNDGDWDLVDIINEAASIQRDFDYNKRLFGKQ